MIAIPPPNLIGHHEERISYPSGFKATLQISSPPFNQVSVTTHISRSKSFMNCFIKPVLLLQDLRFIRQIDSAFGLGMYLNLLDDCPILRAKDLGATMLCEENFNPINNTFCQFYFYNILMTHPF